MNTYGKMHRFEVGGERVFVLLSAGNLSTAQGVVHRIDRQFEEPGGHGLLRAATLFDAAEYAGRMSREIRNDHGAHHAEANFDATFLLGGQIRGRADSGTATGHLPHLSGGQLHPGPGGQTVPADRGDPELEIVRAATGEALGVDAFLAHLRRRYQD